MAFLLFIFVDRLAGEKVTTVGLPHTLLEKNKPKNTLLENKHDRQGNYTERIVIGATPEYYVTWSIFAKIFVFLLILFVLVTNSGVIYIYHKLRRKITMHEIHVTHLAVVDLIAGFMVTIPMVSGYLDTVVSLSRDFYILCFLATLCTHSCNVMATLICNVISYDRLRLLQLGIRYHLVHTRVFSIARLAFLWLFVIMITVVIALLITMSPLAKRSSACTYSLVTTSWPIRVFMSIVSLGPLSVLVILNCLVRSKVRKLEERHPHVTHRTRSSSMVRNLVHRADNDGDTSTGWVEYSSTGIASTSFVTSEHSSPQRRKGPGGSAGNISKSLMRSFKSDRSLSRRATASIFVSTMTFILCLSPLCVLLLVEAWFPSTITTSTHRWHLWLTLIRTAVDPFLFARSIPSFRNQYGTSVIKWQENYACFRCLRQCFCFPLRYMDELVVKDAKERIDRKKRSSPTPARRVSRSTEKTGEVGQISEKSQNAGSQRGRVSEESTLKLAMGPSMRTSSEPAKSTEIY